MPQRSADWGWSVEWCSEKGEYNMHFASPLIGWQMTDKVCPHYPAILMSNNVKYIVMIIIISVSNNYKIIINNIDSIVLINL